MRITMLAYGTRGDVQPFIALGVGLTQAGHRVKINATQEFEPLIRSYGLEFAPLSFSAQTLAQTEVGREVLSGGRNLIKVFQKLKELVMPLVEKNFEEAAAACAGAEAIIYGPLACAGYYIGRKMGVPVFAAYMHPTIRNSATPSVVASFPFPLGRLGNLTSHVVAEKIYKLLVLDITKFYLRQGLDLPPAHLLESYTQVARRKQPHLLGYSPSVLPPPRVWGDLVDVTGYWNVGPTPGWTPPAALVKFIQDGPPPVSIGFGSMSIKNPEQTFEIVRAALGETKRRGILLRGWGGIEGQIDENIFVLDSVPHDWLFPQMAGIVHHGGAGTTGTTLQSGVPGVVVSFSGDQPFWADTVHRLGVSPKPIPSSKLSADLLGAAINQAVTNPAIRARAAALGRRIRQERGVQNAVELFNLRLGMGERLLGKVAV